MIRRIGLVALPIAASLASAQNGEPRSFEVASVKPHDQLSCMYCFHAVGRQVNMGGYNVQQLIQDAYKLKRYQVSFAPSARPDDDLYYDIVGKAEGDAKPTNEQIRLMLQSLLAERFHLKFRREQKEMPVYLLVVGKDGPKFKESVSNAKVSVSRGFHGRNRYVQITKLGVDNLTDEISVNRPVLNRTGLTGVYDIRLEATPESRLNVDPQPEDIDIFQAVQDQLGLRLVAGKAMIDLLVVEQVEKPSGN
jgi:uncharacterized protein (TIGR03435 family)